MNGPISVKHCIPVSFELVSVSKHRSSIFQGFTVLWRNKKGYDKPIVRAKENPKLSYDGLILRKSKILAHTIVFVNVQRVVCDY